MTQTSAARPAVTEKGSSTWNVLTSPWLEVMDLQGRPLRLAPLQALQDAAKLHRIALANPLDGFAAHRFLLTLLYWTAESAGGVEKTRKALLAGNPPRAVISQLKSEVDCFNLFDAKRPFLQDPAVKTSKVLSAGSLFAEMASGTNVAHFHHGDDEEDRLCVACAVQGLLRLVPWTQSGGAGKQPSVHGAPPIMALAIGKTLSETLGLNLVSLDASLGKPQWSGQFKPSGRKGGISVLEALTWNPRRVHLLEPQPPSLCSFCGGRTLPTVGPIVYEKNPACQQTDEYMATWRDPAAFYRPDDQRTAKTTKESEAAIGSDVRRISVQHFGKKPEPAPQATVGSVNTAHSNWLVVLPCTNPANNKSYDHRCMTLPALGGEATKPPPLWHESEPWQAGDERNLPSPNHWDSRPTPGMSRFALAASHLDDVSWGIMAAAADRSMDEDPAAFDIFTGLYWPLRNKHRTLPSRPAAWLALKLMATAGKARPRPSQRTGSFRPWHNLARLSSPVKKRAYPRALPSSRILEHELREIIRRGLSDSPSSVVDWPGLCQFLHNVLR
jgi:hypothetical protein